MKTIDYLLLTRGQRFNLRKKGFDVPLLRRGKSPEKGYDTAASMRCNGCGNEFIGLKDPNTKRNFCSANCYRSNLSGSENPNYKGGYLNKKCKGCGEHFEQNAPNTKAHIALAIAE